MARVVLAMSGGVDSSVAAYLLLQQGHEPIGVFMRHGVHSPATACARREPAPLLPIVTARTDHKQGCCSAADAADARRVADHLDIPFYALDLQEEFARIIDYFVAEYTVGRTPNPCVMCNNWLKFGKLFDYADSIGAEFVATGHYARLTPASGSGIPQLRRGIDAAKDQTYVLFGVERRMLRRMLLPVGESKSRRFANSPAAWGCESRTSPTARKSASSRPGNTTSSCGSTAPRTSTPPGTRHDRWPSARPPCGDRGFTIGQRRGLGVALGHRAFVVRIEPETRRVVIGQREDLARRP